MRPALPAVILLSAALIAGCGNDTSSNNDVPQGNASAGTSSPSASSPTAAGTPPPAASPTPDGRVVAVSFAGGQVSGDTARVKVKVGESVTIRVASDVADEVHLHGYDLTAPVAAGGTTTLSFEATIPGVFELELEERGKELLSLQVQ